MTRLFYGYSGGDVIAQVDVEDGDFAPATTTFDVFTTRTGSTQHTDLLTAGGVAISQVVPDASGRITFQGVDAYTGSYWLQDTANPTAARWRVTPVDIAERTAGSLAWTDVTGKPSTFPPDTHTHTATAISDSTAAGRTLLTAADAAAQRTALAAAPLASPTFTGDPKAPTPVTTDNDTSVATTAFVQAVAAAKVAAAPWMWTGDLLGVGGSAPIEVPVASTVTALKLRVDTGPVGSALTVEIHKNTGSGWVTQDSLTIADGASGPVSKTGLSIAFAAGDLVRLYNVAVGSSSAARGVSLVATLA